jgi:hypothetical protein
MTVGRIPVIEGGIQPTLLDAKGDLISASANDTPARLAVGTNEHRLVAASGETTGLKYVADTTNYAVAAKGDLLVGTAADTLAPLTVGTNGQTLVADSTAATGLKWATASAAAFVGCKLTSNASPSITTATYTALAWNGEDFDTDAFHDNATNNTRITIPSGKAGKYQVTGLVEGGNNATGYMNTIIRKNGTTDELAFAATNSTQYPSGIITGILNLSVADYLEVVVWQNTGTTQTFYQTKPNGTFSVVYLGA